MVLAALVGVLAGCAAAADDASALVQAQVRRHGQSAQRHVATAARSLVRGPGGIFLERWTEAAPGNSMQLNISTGCEVDDEFGQSKCSLHWGDNVTISGNIHLDKGISPGDKMVTAFNITVEGLNKSDNISKFFAGVPMATRSSCEVCSGSCTSTSTGGGLLMEMTRPTFLTGEAWCGTGENSISKITDANISNVTFTMPAGFPATWQLTGEATMSTSITQNGVVTVASTIKQAIIQGGPSSVAMQAVPGLAKASSFLEAIDQMYRQTVPAMLKESRKPQTLKKYNLMSGGLTRKKKQLNTMIVGVSVSDGGDGSVTEYTLSADHGCTSPGAGTVNCHFPFDSSSNLTVGTRVSYTATEGSYAQITMKPKMGGMMGAMVSSLLKPIHMQVPLCGAKATVKVGTSKTQGDFGLCGFFAYRLVAPPFNMFLPDLAGIPTPQQPGMPAMPMMPSTLGEFPPMGVEVDTVMLHANGTKMGQFSTVVALDYQ